MKKRVLCLYYSQTGQLERIVRSLSRSLVDAEHVDLTFAEIRPENSAPFPWPFLTFFNTFPETVHEIPAAVKNLDITEEELDKFDLIILGYQVWFLSPSIPVASFLRGEQAKRIFDGKPVITVIGCRNMWLMAQERMKSLLSGLNAQLIDNVVLTDSAGAALSFFATPLWMLTGNKGPIGIIPKAGVSEEEIDQASRFGDAISKALANDQDLTKPLLTGLGAVKINPNLIASEKVAKTGFLHWGRLLLATGKHAPWLRKPIVIFYIVYLITLILTLVPISALIKKLLSPLLKTRIKNQIEYFSQPSGSSTSGISFNNEK